MKNDQEYFAQIERHERNPVVRRILVGDTSFEKEVGEFYGLSMSYRTTRFGGVKTFEPRNLQIGNKGYPKDLVKILSPFSEEPLNPEKLQFDTVIKDYARWNNPWRNVLGYTCIVGGILTCEFGLAMCVNQIIKGHSIPAIPAVISTLGFLFGGYKTISSLKPPKGTDGSLLEFRKLYETAESADGFIGENYRNYLVKRALQVEG